MRAALCALMLALTVWPIAARADDVGPRKDVAAIRRDLVQLRMLWRTEHDIPVSRFFIDSVVVNGDQALAQWRGGEAARLAWMRYRYGRWWLFHEIWTDNGGIAAICCPGFYTPMDALGPTPRYLVAVGVPSELVTIASMHLPLVEQAAAAPTLEPQPCPTPGHCLVKVSMHGDGFLEDRLSFSRHDVQPLETDNIGSYTMCVQFAPSDASPEARIVAIAGRVPTKAESWMSPGGNSYFFFSGTVQSPQPVHVQAGTTIDVWFPFVLDTTLRYSLTIAGHGFPPIGPVDGTLADNSLHFVLPAFTAAPGVELMGEVEGD